MKSEMAPKVLLVDDDVTLCEALRFMLTKEGFDVEVAHNGVEGLKKCYTLKPDLVILDFMMPDMDGWQICTRLREVSNVPIIMLSAMGGQEYIIKGLKLGADDYIAKPVTAQELSARIRAVLRRRQSSSSSDNRTESSIVIDNRLMIDFDKQKVTVDDKQIYLTPTEFRLLSVFVKHKGRVLPYEFLLHETWGSECVGEVDYLQSYVSRIRHKLEEDPKNPNLILNERGIGYKFEAGKIESEVVDHKELIAQLEQEKSELLADNKRLNHQYQDALRQIDTLRKRTPVPLRKLGQFVSGIVHDLRGGLGIISNTAGFMLEDLDKNDPLATDAQKILHSAEFCEVVIRNLMALGGPEIFESTEVNIESVFREVSFMLEHKLVKVTLVVEADPDTPTIRADEGQLKQVFMNLIKNAGEAMPKGGTLTCRTRREGEMLRIEISDTGRGISSKNQAQLFQKYFTTKERGYGLGLSIVQTIVQRHGGTITVESKLGEGTTFILHLPIKVA